MATKQLTRPKKNKSTAQEGGRGKAITHVYMSVFVWHCQEIFILPSGEAVLSVDLSDDCDDDDLERPIESFHVNGMFTTEEAAHQDHRKRFPRSKMKRLPVIEQGDGCMSLWLKDDGYLIIKCPITA